MLSENFAAKIKLLSDKTQPVTLCLADDCAKHADGDIERATQHITIFRHRPWAPPQVGVIQGCALLYRGTEVAESDKCLINWTRGDATAGWSSTSLTRQCLWWKAQNFFLLKCRELENEKLQSGKPNNHARREKFHLKWRIKWTNSRHSQTAASLSCLASQPGKQSKGASVVTSKIACLISPVNGTQCESSHCYHHHQHAWRLSISSAHLCSVSIVTVSSHLISCVYVYEEKFWMEWSSKCIPSCGFSWAADFSSVQKTKVRSEAFVCIASPVPVRMRILRTVDVLLLVFKTRQPTLTKILRQIWLADFGDKFLQRRAQTTGDR